MGQEYVNVYSIVFIFQLCAAINNCEQVRRSLNITEKLHMDDMSLAYERDASRLNVRNSNSTSSFQCFRVIICGNPKLKIAWNPAKATFVRKLIESLDY